jgi:hypothetical protein
VAVALVALVLAGAIAFLAFDPFSGGDSNASGSSADTSASATEPTSEATQPSTSESAPTTSAPAPTTAAGGPLRAQDVDKAVKDFFKDVPDDLQDAYARTSPSFQSRYPYEGFVGFWSAFDDVKVSNIRTEDGSPSATVDIEYIWPDGKRQTERHVITFVEGDGGLLLDGDDGQGVIG